MDIRTNIINCVDTFVSEHKQEMEQFALFQNKDESKKPSAFDYIPAWNQNLPDSENPFKNPLVEELAHEVSLLVFGEDYNAIKFDLHGHIKNVDGKNWSEVVEYEKNFSWTTYSYQNAFETLKREVFLDMIESAFFDTEENRKFRLHNFHRNQFRHIFDSSYCRNCDKNVDIFFNVTTRTFESNAYFKACPKISSIMNFSLDLPSKKLVIVNDIREAFEVNRKDENTITVNSIHGKVLECQAYMEHNIAYIPLCSGVVSVIQNPKEKKIALDVLKNTYYTKGKKDNCEKVLNEGFEEAGNVYLGLWAVFMLDFDHYKKLCEEKGFDLNHFEPVYVSVNSDELNIICDVEKLLVEAEY